MSKPLPPTPFQLLIVAKSYLQDGYCVEGIAQNGRIVRIDVLAQQVPEVLDQD